jgi:two-component system, cell cycle sensor histidine kinase and response regulator CckA
VTLAVDLHGMLQATLPEITRRAGPSVVVRCEFAILTGTVPAEADALRMAILELVQNAVAAMPEGGTLTVRTEHVEAVGAELGPVPPLAAGRYLRVTVQDTGRGMDEAERAGAIEAPADRPRGLLRVLELVRTIGGALWLDSAIAYGTRAFLYLPIDASPLDGPRETVLLVEDESSVRAVVRRMLQGQGFAVREARDGESALRIWQAERAAIRVVVTDVVMPVMGGRDLARALRSFDPDVPVLFISAYAGDEPGLLDGVGEPRRLLSKPFTNESMLQVLRELLRGGEGAA